MLKRCLLAFMLVFALSVSASDEARRSPIWFTRGTVFSITETTIETVKSRLTDAKSCGANIVCLPFADAMPITEEPTSVSAEVATQSNLMTNDLRLIVKEAKQNGFKVMLDLTARLECKEELTALITNILASASVDGFFCSTTNNLSLKEWDDVRKTTMKKYPSLVLVSAGDCSRGTVSTFDAIQDNDERGFTAADVRAHAEAFAAAHPGESLRINVGNVRDVELALSYYLPGIPLIGNKHLDFTQSSDLAEMRRTNPAFDAPCAPVKWLKIGDSEKIIAFERTDKRGRGFRFVGNLSGEKAVADKLELPAWGFTVTELPGEVIKRGSEPGETDVMLEVISSDSVNLLDEPNWNLMNGYSGWYSPPNYHRSIKAGVLKAGKAYVVSCLIRPHAKDARAGINGYGTGLQMTTWSKDWKSADGVSAVGSSLGEWKRVYSQPWVHPKWGALTQIFLKGNPEPDMIRDVRVTPAECELQVTASSPKNIRQVRVLDINGATVADTGVMAGTECFSTNFTVAARGQYRVLAVDSEGDLAWKDVGE